MTQFDDDDLDGFDGLSLGFNLESLIELCTQQIAQGADYPAYIQQLAFFSLDATPSGAANSEQVEYTRRIIHTLARAIWKHCPHPAHRYAPAPLPPVERNTPCFCGSNRKYKHCCQPLEAEVPPLDLNWLEQLIDSLPKTRWKELVGSRIPVEMMIGLAGGWHQEGEHEDVVALLEPWFADDRHLTHRYEPMQNLLIEAYTDLDKPRKKAELLDRSIARGDAAMRSSAQQRRASIAGDEGDFARAWDLFKQAQRSAPDDVSLSHLEVILLMSEGREPEARERAKFWLTRLARRSDAADLEGLMDFLRSVAQQGAAAMMDVAAEMNPDFDTFRQRWNAAPPISSLYALEAEGDSAGPLTPKPELERALSEWRGLSPAMDYSPLRQHQAGWWDGDMAWLDLLERRPELWNSFEVLDAMIQALFQLPIDIGQHLELPLLERAESLLREVLRSNACEGLKLDWTSRQNRPALNLMNHLASMAPEGAPDDTTLARMRWIVDTLNPQDNGGIRFELMQVLLLQSRFDEAIALSDRYPNDFSSMRYDRVLALYASGRVDEAADALREAATKMPNVLKYLLAANPKPAISDRPGVRIGGNEEGWLYRESHLALWQRHDALDWARKVTRKRGTSGK